MEERKLTEKESLEVITSMIARTKQRYMGYGNIALMWGYLIIAVTALIWVLLVVTHNSVWNWLWFLIWIIGGIATPIMSKKQERNNGVKTYTDKISSRIWSVVGYSAIVSTFCCLGFLLFGGKDSWSMMFAFALIIGPMAEIMQGIVVNEKSLIFGGSCGLLAGIFVMCCIAGGVTLYASWIMPLFIVAYACMLIIPGHILNYKAKHQ